LKLDESEYQCQLRDVSEFSSFLNEDNQKRKLKDLAADFLNGHI